jgi:hypothetical protein
VEGGHRLLLQPSLFVDGGFEECTTCPEGGMLQGDTVRALKVSPPLVATSDNSHVHVSLDLAGILVLGKWRIRGEVDGEFYLERFDDDGALVTDAWYPVCTWGFNTEINSPGMGVDNLGVVYNLSAGNITASGTTTLQDVSAASLTVAGVNVASALAASEPSFTAVAPLQKTTNIQTGQVELRVDTTGLGGSSNPCWINGIFNGSTMEVQVNDGRYPLSISRVIGYAAGVYRISWTTPHPYGTYYVVNSVVEDGYVYVRPRAVDSVTSTGFTLVVKAGDTSNALQNRIVSVSVVAPL